MRYSITLGLILIILCSGCAYQPKKLAVHEKVELSYKSEKEGLQLCVYATPALQNHGYFKEYVPLRLQIKNKSKSTYILNSKNISLEITNVDELKKNIPKVVLSYFIPSAIFTLGGVFFWWQICFPLALVGGVASVFFGKFHKQKITKRLKGMTLGTYEKVRIRPFCTIDKVVFVKKENYNPRFKLNLFNVQEEKFLTFNVLITAKNNPVYRFD